MTPLTRPSLAARSRFVVRRGGLERVAVAVDTDVLQDLRFSQLDPVVAFGFEERKTIRVSGAG